MMDTGSLYSGWPTYPQEFFATAVSVCQKRPAISPSWATLDIEDRGAVAAA